MGTALTHMLSATPSLRLVASERTSIALFKNLIARLRICLQTYPMKFASCLGTCVLAVALILSAFIIRGGLRQLSRSIEQSSHATPSATTRPTIEATRLLAADEPLRPGDQIETTVYDVIKSGEAYTRVYCLGTSGTIRLAYINEVPALGHGSSDLEVAIAKAFSDKHYIEKAVVSVTARRPIS